MPVREDTGEQQRNDRTDRSRGQHYAEGSCRLMPWQQEQGDRYRINSISGYIRELPDPDPPEFRIAKR